MQIDTNETQAAGTVEHFLAGLAVWAVMMLAYAIV